MALNCSDFDCPQFVAFGSKDFGDSSTPRDGTLTSSPLFIKKFKNDSLIEESMETEEKPEFSDGRTKSIEYSLVSCTPASLKESYMLQDDISPVSVSYSASLSVLEPSVTEFPVHKPTYVEESRNKVLKRNVTKVKEFQLTEVTKRKRDDYLPLAEQVAAFHKKTPKRFHTTGPKDYQPAEHWNPPIVIAKSPELQAAKRCRVNTAISRAEQEEKEVEEMKNYRFHARPLNSKVLSTPHLPKKQKKILTKPKSIQFKTAERAAVQYSKKKEEPKYEFHANPVPKAILDGLTGLKEKIHIPATSAKSPAFALKTRAEKWKIDNKRECSLPAVEEFKARPIPNSSLQFIVKHEIKCTEVQPFSFDHKDKERFALKKQKIEEVIEKENAIPSFKAQALPSLHPQLPSVPKKAPTQVMPFNFCSANNSTRYMRLNNTEIMKTNFKARPATVLTKPPFVPEKVHKELEIQEFQLQTQERAKEWQKNKELQDIKERGKEICLAQQRAEEEERERLELIRLRKEIVHKANPIRNYKKLEIKPSQKPLTVPRSPNFSASKGHYEE